MYVPSKCIYVRWGGVPVLFPFRHRRCSGHSMPPTPYRSSWNSSPLVGTAPTAHVTSSRHLLTSPAHLTSSRHQLMSPARVTSSCHQLTSPAHVTSSWCLIVGSSDPSISSCAFSNGQCSCTDSRIQQSQQGCGCAVQPPGGWVGTHALHPTPVRGWGGGGVVWKGGVSHEAFMLVTVTQYYIVHI